MISYLFCVLHTWKNMHQLYKIRWKLWQEGRTLSIYCCCDQSVWKENGEVVLSGFFLLLTASLLPQISRLETQNVWFKLPPHLISLLIRLVFFGKLCNMPSILTANTVLDIVLSFCLIQRPFFLVVLVWQIGIDVPWLHSDVLETVCEAPN